MRNQMANKKCINKKLIIYINIINNNYHEREFKSMEKR